MNRPSNVEILQRPQTDLPLSFSLIWLQIPSIRIYSELDIQGRAAAPEAKRQTHYRGISLSFKRQYPIIPKPHAGKGISAEQDHLTQNSRCWVSLPRLPPCWSQRGMAPFLLWFKCGKNQGTWFPRYSWDTAQCTEDLINRYDSVCHQMLHKEGSCRGSFQKSLAFCPMNLWIPDTDTRWGSLGFPLIRFI